ncbi:MAG: TylF/MycF/NovP-related O-methyltransferase [Candidatus Lokiarchaeia archaeon]
MIFGKIIKKLFYKLGYTIVDSRIYNPNDKNFIPYDIEEDFREIFLLCRPFTMTSVEKMYAMYKATEYLIKNEIAGDIVECGVWKGGSMMISALTLLRMNETNRSLYLYDTYEGMAKPTAKDIKIFDKSSAIKSWNKKKKDDHVEWCYTSLEEVKKNLYSTGYSKKNIKFIKGKVQDSIPNIIPEKISLLRLDTDLYESTYHELTYLYPKLMKKGILIIDDYGFWKGQKEAVDHYFQENNINIFLNRIDEEGRITIKT